LAQSAEKALSFYGKAEANMRILVAMTLALGLCGCADSQFIEHPITSLFGSAEDAQPAAEAAAESPAARPAPDAAQASAQEAAHCARLAKLRAGDAAFEGEDTDTQRSVYDSTYSGCIDWSAKHRPNS
jgi:hypothetical protein